MIVEEKPASFWPPPYPELLRKAGIAGHVLVQVIIDISGRAEPTSVPIVQSSNPGVDKLSQHWMLRFLTRATTSPAPQPGSPPRRWNTNGAQRLCHCTSRSF